MPKPPKARRAPRAWTPDRPKKKPTLTLVGSLLAGSKTTTARLAGVSIDWVTWREIVGDRVARRTVPGKIQDGVLSVGVESPVWAQELSLLSDEVIARLRSRGFAVTVIRFRSGVAAGRVPTPKAPVERLAPRAPLPEDLAQRLELIDDTALRETIATAAAHSLGARAERAKKAKRRRLPR